MESKRGENEERKKKKEEADPENRQDSQNQ